MYVMYNTLRNNAYFRIKKSVKENHPRSLHTNKLIFNCIHFAQEHIDGKRHRIIFLHFFLDVFYIAFATWKKEEVLYCQ